MDTLTGNIVQRLESANLNMTPTQEKIRNFLLHNPVDVGYMSLKELSVGADVSEVSVLNFSRMLGFENYIAMRETFRDFTRSCMSFCSGLGQEASPEGARLGNYGMATMRSHYEILSTLDLDLLSRCAKTLSDSHNVFVLGHDVSKIAADYLSSRLNYLHIRSQSVNLGDRDTVKVLLSDLRPNDTVVVFSFPPYYDPGSGLAEFTSSRGATVIVVADSMDSPVVSENCLFIPCKTKNPYFFNWMSVPIHFTEILAYYISMRMGKKGEDIIKGFNALGND